MGAERAHPVWCGQIFGSRADSALVGDEGVRRTVKRDYRNWPGWMTPRRGLDPRHCGHRRNLVCIAAGQCRRHERPVRIPSHENPVVIDTKCAGDVGNEVTQKLLVSTSGCYDPMLHCFVHLGCDCDETVSRRTPWGPGPL